MNYTIENVKEFIQRYNIQNLELYRFSDENRKSVVESELTYIDDTLSGLSDNTIVEYYHWIVDFTDYKSIFQTCNYCKNDFVKYYPNGLLIIIVKI